MKSKPPYFHSILCTALLCLSLQAQDSEDQPTPSPPYVAAPAENDAWFVTYKYADGPPVDENARAIRAALKKNPEWGDVPGFKVIEQNYPAQVVSQIAGDIRRDRITFTDGSSTEAYVVGGVQAFDRGEDEGGVEIRLGGTRNPATPYAYKDYLWFSWVGPETFQEVKTIDGRKAFVYASPKIEGAEEGETAGDAGVPLTKESNSLVYIDVQSGKPLAIVWPGKTAEFKHGQEGPTQITVPEKFRTPLERVLDARHSE